MLHLAVVVVVPPHRRLKLGPAELPPQLQGFLNGVMITGEAGFQRVQALRVHLVACA